MFGMFDAAKINANLIIEEIKEIEIEKDRIVLTTTALLCYMDALGEKVLFSQGKRDYYFYFLHPKKYFKDSAGIYSFEGLTFTKRDDSQKVLKQLVKLVEDNFEQQNQKEGK